MTDLIDKLLAAIPAYVRQMIDLLRHPKEFMATIGLESDSATTQALTFLAISFGLAFIAQIPLLPRKLNTEVLFGVGAVQTAIAFAVDVALLALCWRLVGGQLPLKKFVVVSCYCCGVSMVLMLMVTLVALGAFVALDPVNGRFLLNGTVPDPVDLVRSVGFKACAIIFAGGLLTLFLWIFLFWGAYRKLNQVSKTRSAIAYVIYLLLSPIPLGLQLLMGSVVSPPTIAPFPAELVGTWATPFGNGAHNVMYNFDPQGYYVSLEGREFLDERCHAVIVEKIWGSGHASVKDSMLTMHPWKRGESSSGSCPGTKPEPPVKLTNVVYQYAIRQRPEGRELCLSGPFGETCMVPQK